MAYDGADPEYDRPVVSVSGDVGDGEHGLVSYRRVTESAEPDRCRHF